MWQYTGVGARATPAPVGRVMYEVAAELGQLGGILRSGMATGADTFFEIGCDRVDGAKEIYLPWPHPECLPPVYISAYDVAVIVKSLQIVKAIHPDFSQWKPSSRKLHLRNVPQVLGQDLDTPSRFLICWTPGGEWVGGTRTAIRVAESWGIKVMNLGEPALQGMRSEAILDALRGQGYLP